GSGVATAGAYSITSAALAVGVHTITAAATDIAGNPGAASAGLSLSIQPHAAFVPSIPDLTAAADSGPDATDNITNVATPSFTGTAEAGSTVTILSDGIAVGSGLAAGGSYIITTAALADGTHSITASNTSGTSSALALTIDTDAPD